MGVLRKRKILEHFCKGRKCRECPLFDENHIHGTWDGMSDDQICLYFDKLNEVLHIESKLDYWSNICEMQKKQTEKGIKTYGQPLEDNNSMTIFDRLEYLEEELIDGLMYIEHIKEKLYQFRDLLNEEARE